MTETDNIQVALLNQKVGQMEAHMEAQDIKIQKLEEERNSALKYGIVSLGTGMLALIAFIVELFTGHK